jgi:hypothetical protein
MQISYWLTPELRRADPLHLGAAHNIYAHELEAGVTLDEETMRRFSGLSDARWKAHWRDVLPILEHLREQHRAEA